MLGDVLGDVHRRVSRGRRVGAIDSNLWVRY